MNDKLIYTKLQLQEVRDRFEFPDKVKPKDISALYKLIMIGNAGTGKTSLLLRFTEDEFKRNQNCTVGVDIKMKVLKVDNKTIKL